MVRLAVKVQVDVVQSLLWCVLVLHILIRYFTKFQV